MRSELEIRPLSPPDVLRMAMSGSVQPGQSWAAGVINADHAEELCRLGRAFAAISRGQAVGAAGVVPVWDGRAVAWALFAEGWRRHALAITRAARRELDRWPGRVELSVACDWPEAHRWARALGFEMECARARRYHADGTDAALYARFRDG